ncbi:MAG TPA: Gfo/Idh/MocA family oxidoreductase [Tepidisphaeraceae bacterium]|nr:Gfo/Idh/MocA family oxidoreductase [Tepidisphaeraceae bacterium]
MPDQPQKLRVGVIGAGWWSTTAHIPAIQQHPRAELTAVHRRSLQGARQVARDFGIPHAFDDWQALIDSKLCDAVIVGTTPNVHFEQTRAALQAGLHVLCEKPFTLHAAEARELVEIAQSSGLQLLISCPWHFTPHGIEARRLIRSGALGQIKMISMLMTNPVHRLLKGLDTTPTHGTKVYVEPNAGSYNDPSIAGGGQIYCQVSHAAAYLN